MPSVDTLAAAQKKRKRSRRSSNDSLTTKNPKVAGNPALAKFLKAITLCVKGKRIENFIFLEGGLSLAPLKLSQEILQDVLKDIDGCENLTSGT